MRKNGVIYLLGACVLATLVLVAVQARQLGALKESLGRIEKPGANSETVNRRLAQLEEQAATEKAAFQEAERRLRSELDRERTKGEEKLAQLEKAIQDLMAGAHTIAPTVAPPDKEVLPSNDLATSSSETERPFARIAKLLEDPAMKNMVRAQQKTMLDMTYRALHESLDISDAQMETLKGLLLDKQMKQMDLGLEMMNKSLTDEERKAKTVEIENLAADIDNQIKSLLGEKNYELYKYVEDTQTERMQINLFKQSLSTLDQLDLKQEEALIFAMNNARKDFAFTTEPREGQDILDFTRMSPDAIRARLEEMRKLEEQYVAAAGKILTPEQLRQFIAYLERQRSMQEAMMKMMFGGPSGNVEPPSTGP